jgi:hypothetical protein
MTTVTPGTGAALTEYLRKEGDSVPSEQLERRFGLSRTEIYRVVTDLLISGVPVYFENDLRTSLRPPKKDIVYRYAKMAEELYPLRAAAEREAETLSALHSGVEEAQVSFHPHQQDIAPSLFTAYAIFGSDGGPLFMHFTRQGFSRTCSYRSFGESTAVYVLPETQRLLDQCFEGWELGKLTHELVGYEHIEFESCISVQVASADEARVHIDNPRFLKGERLGIDVPPECGGPFEALGEQLECLPESLRSI